MKAFNIPGPVNKNSSGFHKVKQEQIFPASYSKSMA